MFNDIHELFKEIHHIETKIQKAKDVLNASEYTNIQIHLFADKKHVTIYQGDTPFSLTNEVKMLLLESIDMMEQQIQNMKLNF
jgi:hypothetical protein